MEVTERIPGKKSNREKRGQKNMAIRHVVSGNREKRGQKNMAI
jgi:hypothetical protein